MRIKLLSFFALLVLVSCNRKLELATVQSDLLFPIAYGELELTNYVESESFAISGSDTLVLQVNDTVVSLGLGDIIGIPDTTLRNEYEVPFSGLTFPPGVPFHGDTIATKYKIGGAQLKYADIKQGNIRVKLTNTIDKPVVFTYQLISASLNGVTFEIQETVAANSFFNKSYSLAGYSLDLRGPNGNGFNTVAGLYTIMIDPNETASHTFKSGDKFTVENTFQNFEPNFITGYFGSRNVQLAESVETALFQQYPFEFLDFDAFDLVFTIDNGIGADLGLTINNLTSIASNSLGNASLSHPLVNDAFNVNRATQLYQTNNLVKHVQKQFVFNNSNSNLDELVENAPTEMQFDLDVNVNPYGNISLGNDFAFYGHDLSVIMNGALPLALGLGGLHLRDTADYRFVLSENDSLYSDRINEGMLRIKFENGYPLEALTQIYLVSDVGSIVDSAFTQPTNLSAAEFQGDTLATAESIFEIPFNQQKLTALESGSKLLVDVKLSTANQSVVAINSQSRIKYKMVMEVNADL